MVGGDGVRIAICDDLLAERQTIRGYLARYDHEHNFEYVVAEYDSAEGLIVGLSKEPVHLIFFDIYMDGMTGMDAAKLLKADGYKGHIIFTTTSKDHAVTSYSLAADGYLVKPFSYDEFADSFSRVASRWLDSFRSIIVRSDRLEFQIYLKDIEYIESNKRNTIVHARGESLKTTKPLSEFAVEFEGESCFLRCHQGYIVNLNFAKTVEEDDLLLTTGARVLINMRNKTQIKQALVDYHWRKMRDR